MREPEIRYQVWGYVWNEAKREREAEAYELALLAEYKTERGARNYFDKFRISDDIPLIKLYKDVKAWDGMPLEHEELDYKDE